MPKNPGAQKQKTELSDLSILGTTVMGERGQVVIPKDVRDRIGLKPGSQLMVMQKDGPIMLIPIDHMRHLMEHMNEYMSKISSKR